MSQGGFGFLIETKMKAYAKLTVVMCCPIFAKRPEAPSNGNFCRQTTLRYASEQDQEFSF